MTGFGAVNAVGTGVGAPGVVKPVRPGPEGLRSAVAALIVTAALEAVAEGSQPADRSAGRAPWPKPSPAA